MSDFGTVILINKKNKSNFSNNEISNIETELTNFIALHNIKMLSKDKLFSVDIQKEYNKQEELYILLSDHYYGNDEIENLELFEFVEDNELFKANKIIEFAKITFPNFDFKSEVIEF